MSKDKSKQRSDDIADYLFDKMFVRPLKYIVVAIHFLISLAIGMGIFSTLSLIGFFDWMDYLNISLQDNAASLILIVLSAVVFRLTFYSKWVSQWHERNMLHESPPEPSPNQRTITGWQLIGYITLAGFIGLLLRFVLDLLFS